MSKRVTVIVEGQEYVVEVGDLNDTPIKATVNQRTYLVELPKDTVVPVDEKETTATAQPAKLELDNSQAITAPMPGDILEVRVKAGDIVSEGEVICVLEAMKMKNMIHTSHGGKIASVEVSIGQAVDYGTVLVTFE